MSEVQPGDRVAILRRPSVELGSLEENDSQLALLAGAWVSEGWASNARLGFANLDRDFFDQVVTAYDAWVGGPRGIRIELLKSGNPLHRLDVQGKQTAHFAASRLAEILGARSDEKRVPAIVWEGSPAFKRVFLQALFEGDGSSSLLPRNTMQISYSTRSFQLAQDVQELLLEFGVVSRQSLSSRGEIKVVITNRRDARLFAERVGFLGRKQTKLEAELAAVPIHSRALSSDHVPYLADYIRS
ncbi:MAG: DNA gyrase subunit A, partial [Actinobacteria bacterium]|nr:DNA gyrase subunit A [Actinomycetota bacterium]